MNLLAGPFIVDTNCCYKRTCKTCSTYYIYIFVLFAVIFSILNCINCRILSKFDLDDTMLKVISTMLKKNKKQNKRPISTMLERERRERRERNVSLRRTAGACASVPSPENSFRLDFVPFPRCLRRSTIVRLVGALLPSLIVNGGVALESRRIRMVALGGDGAVDARTGGFISGRWRFHSSVDVGSFVGGGGFHRSTVATLASGKGRFL